MEKRVVCELHGEQDGFIVCKHTVEDLLEFEPRTGLVSASNQTPDIYCMSCKSPFEEQREWTDEELEMVSGSIACIECIRAEHGAKLEAHSGLWHRRFSIRPLPRNEKFGDVAETTVDAYVQATSAELAAMVMGMLLEEGQWENTAALCEMEIVQETEVTDPDLLTAVNTAKRDGDCLHFQVAD